LFVEEAVEEYEGEFEGDKATAISFAEGCRFRIFDLFDEEGGAVVVEGVEIDGDAEAVEEDEEPNEVKLENHPPPPAGFSVVGLRLFATVLLGEEGLFVGYRVVGEVVVNLCLIVDSSSEPSCQGSSSSSSSSSFFSTCLPFALLFEMESFDRDGVEEEDE